LEEKQVNTNSIIWVKWSDPHAPLINGRLPKSYQPEEDEENPDYYRSLASFGKEGRRPQTAKSLRPLGAIMTPMGIVPIHESNLPGAIFNFWMGHTNFRINEQEKDVIMNVAGVESIDVFTPYRFRISIGKAFHQKDVMRDIDVACQQPPIPPSPAKTDTKKGGLDAMKAILSKRYPYWFIYKASNGRFEHVGCNKLEEAQASASKFDGELVAKSWEA
jgi:hypothetical protein